jgi:uncharacterized protein (TIGR00369 family)
VDADDDEARRRARRLRILRAFAEAVPHNKALGITIVDLGDAWASYRLRYAEELIGNPETGVLHGGAITALLDACCGSAVFNALPEPQPIATLDLRIDYLAPAEPGRDVVARADCYKVTRNVAFVRAVAYHDDDTAPIASAAGTFMIATKLGRRA